MHVPCGLCANGLKNSNPSFACIIGHKFFSIPVFLEQNHWNVSPLLFEADPMTHYIKLGINWVFSLIFFAIHIYSIEMDWSLMREWKKIWYSNIFHPFWVVWAFVNRNDSIRFFWQRIFQRHMENRMSGQHTWVQENYKDWWNVWPQSHLLFFQVFAL